MSSAVTVLDLLQVAPENKDAIIIPESGIRVSYGELRRQVQAVADALAAVGIRRGDRVAMALPNGLRAIVCFLAASAAGTAAPLNPSYRHDEFVFYLQDTSARVLLCPASGAEEARRAAADCDIPVYAVEMDERGTVSVAGLTPGASAPPPNADDVALILHTSGSTGRPKRVPL